MANPQRKGHRCKEPEFGYRAQWAALQGLAFCNASAGKAVCPHASSSPPAPLPSHASCCPAESGPASHASSMPLDGCRYPRKHTSSIYAVSRRCGMLPTTFSLSWSSGGVPATYCTCVMSWFRRMSQSALRHARSIDEETIAYRSPAGHPHGCIRTEERRSAA